MRATFIKRMGSFILDIIILSIIFSVITMGFMNNNNDIIEELDYALEQYENSEITLDDYNNMIIDLNFKLQKNNFTVNILNIVLYIGYFIVFGFLNSGQTIGKKMFRIKVVNSDGNRPSICNMIVRSLFIYGIITLLYSVIFVYILKSTIFTYGYIIITYVEAILMMISSIMVLYRKDGRGLHDIFGKTNVIEEVK